MRIEVVTRCMTYNHAPYIEDTLRGFAMQETSFPAAFIVVDDASTDGEQDLLKMWVAEHLDVKNNIAWQERPYGKMVEGTFKGKPNLLFVILLLSKNHYQSGNGYKRREYIRQWTELAKYFALCEGDDFWTDKTKLQRQVDYLEQHKECVAVAENGTELNINTGKCCLFNKSSENTIDYTLEELLLKRRFPTASVMYRSELQKTDRFFNMKCRHDTALWCCMASLGTVRFLNINSSVYRRGSGVTITTGRLRWAQTTEKWYLYLLDYFKDLISEDTVTRVMKLIYNHYLMAAVDGIRRHDNEEKNIAIEKLKELGLSSHVLYDVMLRYLTVMKNDVKLKVKVYLNNCRAL